MKKVERDEILGLGPYEEIRPRFRARIIELKKQRRVEIGPHLSMVFENHDTVLSQIQEMLRTERISEERAVQHEIDTYNDLVPGPGALSSTLFIEYTDQAERAEMLVKLATLRQHVHLRVGDVRTTATFHDQAGEEADRLPAVNYLTFEPGAEAAVGLRDTSVSCALEVDHPDLTVSGELSPAVREQLARDLAD